METEEAIEIERPAMDGSVIEYNWIERLAAKAWPVLSGVSFSTIPVDAVTCPQSLGDSIVESTATPNQKGTNRPSLNV